MEKKKEAAAAFDVFAAIIKELRTPVTGCPWDLEQDHRSLRQYLVEESYEVLDAIERADDPALCDELGDLLLQVVLHAQLAAERGAFDIADVIKGVSEKMIRRHPHVFGSTTVSGSADVLKNWEEIKQHEQIKPAAENQPPSPHPVADRLAKVPVAIPALLRSQRVGEKAARTHFDWPDIDGVLGKVKEELAELEVEIAQAKDTLPAADQSRPWPPLPDKFRRALEHELGDTLFSLCQLARWLGVSAEDSLRVCASRFIERFAIMESKLGEKIGTATDAELDQAWIAAKEAFQGKIAGGKE